MKKIVNVALVPQILLALIIFSQPVHAQMKVLMDTKEITIGAGQPNCITWPGGETNYIWETNAQFNWLSPYNYKDGMVYLYIEVISNPPEKYPCIWPIWGTKEPEYVHRWWNFKETSFLLKNCGVYTRTLGRPGGLTHSDDVEWKGHKVSLDNEWETGLGENLAICIQFRGPHTTTDEPCGGPQILWSNEDVFPMKVRMVMVVVAKGYEFMGWDNYIGETDNSSEN